MRKLAITLIFCGAVFGCMTRNPVTVKAQTVNVACPPGTVPFGPYGTAVVPTTGNIRQAMCQNTATGRLVYNDTTGNGVRFNVQTYGAKADARQTVADATTTISSATVTSPTAAFTQADIGKHLTAWLGGTVYIAGTIGAVANATTARLNNTVASQTQVGNLLLSIGTDNTAAFRAAFVDATPYCGTVYMPPGGSGPNSYGYLITAQLELITDCASLEGETQRGSKLVVDPSFDYTTITYFIQQVGGAGGNGGYIGLQNFSIDGLSYGFAVNNKTLIYQSTLYINNVEVDGWTLSGNGNVSHTIASDNYWEKSFHAYNITGDCEQWHSLAFNAEDIQCGNEVQLDDLANGTFVGGVMIGLNSFADTGAVQRVVFVGTKFQTGNSGKCVTMTNGIGGVANSLVFIGTHCDQDNAPTNAGGLIVCATNCTAVSSSSTWTKTGAGVGVTITAGGTFTDGCGNTISSSSGAYTPCGGGTTALTSFACNLGHGSAVTANANTTGAQVLQSCAFTAGVLAYTSAALILDMSGRFTVAVAQTPTINFLWNLDGVNPIDITTGATVAATDNPWTLHAVCVNSSAVGNFICQGTLSIVLGASATGAATVYPFQAAAESSRTFANALTGAMYILFSTQPAMNFNSITQETYSVRLWQSSI